MRVTQRIVVHPREVPDEVRRDPQRQRDERPEEHEATCASCERRRHGEHEQRRRPLGEDDVLQQVRPEKRVQREGLQLREERQEQKRKTDACGRCLGAARTMAARRQEVRERECGDEPDGLRGEVHHATLAVRGCSSMVELQPSKLITRVRFPPPA